MEPKDYSQLNRQLVMYDSYDIEGDCVLAGVAIRAEDTEAFVEAVEQLAVEKFGGATFLELLDFDEGDASMDASLKKNREEQFEAVVAAAERILELAAKRRGK